MLEQMMMLVLQLGLIIFAAFAGSSLFKKMRMPSVLGELLAGTLIGPYLLGGIALPGFEHGLFPHEGHFPISPELYGFTSVASIILLFLVGLETDLKMFFRYSVAGSLVGFGGAIVSFILGDLTTVVLSSAIFGQTYSFMHPIALFLGIVSAATSVGITARILSEKKKVDSPEGVTILSGAVIDDVLGIILLAIVLGIAKSGHVEWGQVSWVALKSIGIWIGFTALGLAFSKHLGRLLKGLHEPVTIAILCLGLALILSGVFEYAGLAMIIGAYVVGLAFSQTDLAFLIQEQISSLYRLFVPLFFCVMGMLVDFRAMLAPGVFLFGLAYTATAVLAKILGCGLPTLLLNFNLRGAVRVGLGMIPRGEVALIISGIGLSAGILPADTFGVAMLMTFLTTLVTPYLLVLALHSNQPGIRKTLQEKEPRSQLEFPLPSPDTLELVLGKVISALRDEGFFVHLLDIQERIYQIRREDTIISMTASGSQLRFNCSYPCSAFISHLLYEVFVELERGMKELQKFDKRNLVSTEARNGEQEKCRAKNRIVRHLNRNCVRVRLQGTTKQEILEELLELLVASKDLAPEHRALAMEDLVEREAIMSSGLHDGVALPHAKSNATNRLACAFGVCREGIDFASLDGQPARIFALVLSPKGTPGLYLQFMAALSGLLNNPEIRQTLLDAGSDDELYRLLTS